MSGQICDNQSPVRFVNGLRCWTLNYAPTHPTSAPCCNQSHMYMHTHLHSLNASSMCTNYRSSSSSLSRSPCGRCISPLWPGWIRRPSSYEVTFQRRSRSGITRSVVVDQGSVVIWCQAYDQWKGPSVSIGLGVQEHLYWVKRHDQTVTPCAWTEYLAMASILLSPGLPHWWCDPAK